jgi:nickel transport protein
MKRVGFVALLLCALNCGAALAHDLQYVVGEGSAVFVRFSLAGEGEFSFESYEIYRDGENVPFQVGRTDQQGRLVFLPDRSGKWRIKVFSEDGHGRDFFITTDAQGGVERAERPVVSRNLRIAIAVALIFGLFGLVNLFARRRGAR